jgi:hypothetical protein
MSPQESLENATRRLWRMRSMWALALVLVAAGAGIDALASVVHSVSWLQAPGAAVIGAGLAVLVSKSASQEAVREQYHKDANLRRKDEYYVPLHTDLKSIADRLADAKGGRQPFPQHVGLKEETYQGPVGLAPPSTLGGGTLWRWVAFRSDSRIDNFSQEARDLLDAAVALAEEYNAAIDAVLPPAQQALATNLTAAIEKTRRLRDFELWRRNPNYMTLSEGEREHWFTKFAGPESPEELGTEWATYWLVQLGVAGWLFGGRPDMAATGIYRNYSMSARPYPPLEWIRPVFDATYRDLESQDTYRDFTRAGNSLFEAVARVEQHLAAGLRSIRDRYEGGEPLV